MSDAKKIMDIIKEKEIQFVDLRFTDLEVRCNIFPTY